MILDAAATLLADGGVAAVQVRAVAARVGMTDAGVAHHFGTRDQLLHELLRDGGRRLRSAVQTALDSWRATDDPDPIVLVEVLAELYRQGFAELAVALHGAGWRDRGSGLLEPLVEAVHSRRGPGASIDDTRLAVAALHQGLALEPLYGSAFRRSAGLTGSAAADSLPQVRWWAGQLARMLNERDA
jgi:TetR/AcrR family transcriptional regulator, repressor for neighboring sulfatase